MRIVVRDLLLSHLKTPLRYVMEDTDADNFWGAMSQNGRGAQDMGPKQSVFPSIFIGDIEIPHHGSLSCAPALFP